MELVALEVPALELAAVLSRELAPELELARVFELEINLVELVDKADEVEVDAMVVDVTKRVVVRTDGMRGRVITTSSRPGNIVLR